MLPFFVSQSENAVPVYLLKADEFEDWCNEQEPRWRAYVTSCGFKAEKGKVLFLPGAEGAFDAVVFGQGDGSDPFVTGALPGLLPAGDYSFAGDVQELDGALLGWALGSYQFGACKSSDDTSEPKRLVVADTSDLERVSNIAEGVFLARNLINIPANEMGPEALANAAEDLAGKHNTNCTVICGGDLLTERHHMIHAVGRASEEAPRLIDFTWGRDDAPKITLVGKGVCFDSGGLNIKPGESMRLMKKDMGGAANTLGLASMIMGAKLDVRLRVLIPAVENAISSNAYRPGDVLQSRKGLTVEIGNTDAEGRLILGDALALADEEAPDLIVDLATLTGAARVAMGPEVPPFYTDDDALADDLAKASGAVSDPVWRLPLWKPYAEGLSSKVADVCHITSGGFAGSITAALFLQKFVEAAKSWVHFDIYGWNATSRPGRDVGGEAQAIRALFEFLSRRYGGK